METTGIVVQVPDDFHIRLKEYVLYLEKKGIKKTKAEALLMLAELGCKKEYLKFYSK